MRSLKLAVLASAAALIVAENSTPQQQHVERSHGKSLPPGHLVLPPAFPNEPSPPPKGALPRVPPPNPPPTGNGHPGPGAAGLPPKGPPIGGAPPGAPEGPPPEPWNEAAREQNIDKGTVLNTKLAWEKLVKWANSLDANFNYTVALQPCNTSQEASVYNGIYNATEHLLKWKDMHFIVSSATGLHTGMKGSDWRGMCFPVAQPTGGGGFCSISFNSSSVSDEGVVTHSVPEARIVIGHPSYCDARTSKDVTMAERLRGMPPYWTAEGAHEYWKRTDEADTEDGMQMRQFYFKPGKHNLTRLRPPFGKTLPPAGEITSLWADNVAVHFGLWEKVMELFEPGDNYHNPPGMPPDRMHRHHWGEGTFTDFMRRNGYGEDIKPNIPLK